MTRLEEWKQWAMGEFSFAIEIRNEKGSLSCQRRHSFRWWHTSAFLWNHGLAYELRRQGVMLLCELFLCLFRFAFPWTSESLRQFSPFLIVWILIDTSPLHPIVQPQSTQWNWTNVTIVARVSCVRHAPIVNGPYYEWDAFSHQKEIRWR